MVSAAPSGRESHRTLGAGVTYRAAVKSRGAGGIAETGAFARRLSICSRAAQPSPLTEPEHCTRYPRRGQAHPVPSAKRRARGRRGQSPRIPSPRRSGLGAARDAPAPPEGQKLQRADPRKGGNDTKRCFCANPCPAGACAKGAARFVSLRVRAGVRPGPTRRRTAAQGDTGATEHARAAAQGAAAGGRGARPMARRAAEQQQPARLAAAPTRPKWQPGRCAGRCCCRSCGAQRRAQAQGRHGRRLVLPRGDQVGGAGALATAFRRPERRDPGAPVRQRCAGG